MNSLDIRKSFLEFFKTKGHTIRPSSSIIPPPDDPTLLFTTAGMVQFKRFWAGHPLLFKRAASVQKCLRAGGKGSDLENVGHTLRHHTFFEMLGNFSFGDYFKKEAIQWAWEFIVDVLKLPNENLWVSVYQGDDEAENIWKRNIGIPENRIVRLGSKDNFWGPAGTTGACGPCSEIYFDLGYERGCGKPTCRPGCECERYLEFWNLVFPQFYQDKQGRRTALERRGIDTGMGLERLAFLMQDDAGNNYETDLFKPIVDGIKKIAKKTDNKVSLYVISDHIRALTFALSENVFPSNDGRGYVLRRLLRRAVKYGRDIGITEPFLYKLTDIIVDVMKSAYPELIKNKVNISRIILNEEKRFQSTLDYGLYILEDILKKQKKNIIEGREIFRLYDTFGFPLDLMREIADEKGFKLDYAGFEKLMSEQKERGRRAWTGGKGAEEIMPFYKKMQKQEFVGYSALQIKTKIIAIKDNEIFLHKTPFYAESGGQVGDTGMIIGAGWQAEVLDTKKILPSVIAHRFRIISGELKLADEVEAVVNKDRRLDIARHHTATHLLQYALRRILGDNVKQAGSLVAPDKLRFDFTHFRDVTGQELEHIEELINEKVLENSPVTTSILPLQDALKDGILAFFGEKYGEKVRVVDIGGYSRELCGGTHLRATGEIGLFRILSEGSVASGVRRIEAVCGRKSLELTIQERRRLMEISTAVKSERGHTVEKVKYLLEENKQLLKNKEDMDLEKLLLMANDILSSAKAISGIKIVCYNAGNVNIGHLRRLGDKLKEGIKSGIIVLGASSEKNKFSILILVTDDLVKKGYYAGRIVKETASIAGGRGGGRPNMAQAGGSRPELLDNALKKVPEIIKKIEKLNKTSNA